MENSFLNITWAGIFKILIAVVLIYLIFIIQDIIIWFVFALVLSILFNYLINALEKRRIPRLLSGIILYVSIFALLSVFIYQTAPLLLLETEQFAQDLPRYLARISPLFEKLGINSFRSEDTFLAIIKSRLVEAEGSVFSALFALFGGATATVLVLAMAFFMSLERNFIERILTAFSPEKHKDYLFRLWGRAKQKVSGWFITRVIGVLFVGASTFIVLKVLGVRYAFILAVLAGLFDLVPIIGPAVAGGLLFLVISLNSLSQALFAVGAFVVIQLLENNVLFPILFKKFIGLSPVLVLAALAIGAKIWGPAGAILAIPLFGVVLEVLKDYLARIRQSKKAACLASSESSPGQAETAKS